MGGVVLIQYVLNENLTVLNNYIIIFLNVFDIIDMDV